MKKPHRSNVLILACIILSMLLIGTIILLIINHNNYKHEHEGLKNTVIRNARQSQEHFEKYLDTGSWTDYTFGVAYLQSINDALATLLDDDDSRLERASANLQLCCSILITEPEKMGYAKEELFSFLSHASKFDDGEYYYTDLYTLLLDLCQKLEE